MLIDMLINCEAAICWKVVKSNFNGVCIKNSDLWEKEDIISKKNIRNIMTLEGDMNGIPKIGADLFMNEERKEFHASNK